MAKPVHARWLRSSAFLMGSALLCGCAGASGSSAASPAATPSAAAGAGKRCIEDARAWPDVTPEQPLRVEVSHILVRHAELERPEGATRTPEQACLRALEALQEVQGGLDWSEAVQRFSDAKSSELGRVSRDELPAGFAETAFSLEINQLSYVVESDRGFHVILRTR